MQGTRILRDFLLSQTLATKPAEFRIDAYDSSSQNSSKMYYTREFLSFFNSDAVIDMLPAQTSQSSA